MGGWDFKIWIGVGATNIQSIALEWAMDMSEATWVEFLVLQGRLLIRLKESYRHGSSCYLKVMDVCRTLNKKVVSLSDVFPCENYLFSDGDHLPALDNPQLFTLRLWGTHLIKQGVSLSCKLFLCSCIFFLLWPTNTLGGRLLISFNVCLLALLKLSASLKQVHIRSIG